MLITGEMDALLSAVSTIRQTQPEILLFRYSTTPTRSTIVIGSAVEQICGAKLEVIKRTQCQDNQG